MTQILSLVLFNALFLQGPSLDSTSPREREAAIEEMAFQGNSSAIPLLAEALKKESRRDLRADMVAALGRIQDRAAVPVLADTLASDPDKDVRLQAIGSLLRLHIPFEETGSLRSMFSRVRNVFFVPDRPTVGPEVQLDPRALEALTAALQRDFDQGVRVEAARALGSLKAREQVPAMVQVLEDPRNRQYRSVRQEIITSLGVIRDPSAGPALETALRDPNRQIVEQAVLAIGLVAYAPARGVLEQKFRTERDRRMRRTTIEALSLMRHPDNVPLFESLLSNSDDNIRELAIEGLGRLDYDASGFRDVYLQERRANVQTAMAFALASSGYNDYINDLANALDSRQDYQAEVYLFELGKFDGKLEELHRYVQSSNPKIRARMARVLGNIGDPSSRDHLQTLTNDPNTEVVREAVAALRRMNL